jgi:hypothetical protein
LSNWPPKSAPANTSRFFVHCSGRRDISSSAAVERDFAEASRDTRGDPAGDGAEEAITTGQPLDVGR